jgi:predicted ester cyclase
MKRFLVLLTVIAFAMACNNAGQPVSSMGTDSVLNAMKMKDSILEKNKATALASVQAFNAGKADAVLQDFATDGVDYGNGEMAPVKGLDSAKVYLKQFMDAFPDMKGENFMVIGDGNHVAVFGDWSGTFKGAMGKMKPTGKMFKVKDVDLYTFNDAGKITEHRSIQSNATIMSQIMGGKK